MLTSADRFAMDMSLKDACKIARRLSRCRDKQAHSAALKLVVELRKLGAKDEDEQPPPVPDRVPALCWVSGRVEACNHPTCRGTY
jgi:hypothetical protein